MRLDWKSLFLPFLLFSGLAAIVIGSYKFLDDFSFNRTAIHVTGKVLYLEPVFSWPRIGPSEPGYFTPGSLLYYPVVEFVTNDNENVTFTASKGLKTMKYKAGDSIDVLYQANNPQNARLLNDLHIYDNIYVIAVGLIFIFIFLFSKKILNNYDKSRAY